MLLNFIGLMVVASPAVLLAVLGLAALVRFRLTEIAMARCAQASSMIGLVASLCILAFMLASGRRDVPLEFGDWVSMHATTPDAANVENRNSTADNHDALADDGTNESFESFHFRLKFVFDRLSVPFVVMSFVLCGVIGAFAFKYMHLESGYGRFFLFYSIFQLGMVLSSLAGTIETLFFGWELVGLSSALLVAFFHDRPSPCRNGLRVWAVYRFADAAFLMAALVLHHLAGSGDFELLMGTGSWPYGVAAITENQALLVGTLLLIAAAGKSALVPFSGWLPRAMEGPTPSSAIFYGALSVHLGAFLLLRVSPVLEASWVLRVMVVSLGLVTMVFAAMTARVQTDVKSALSYASLVQVSIIVVEIGLGLYYIALIHIIGHACVRTLQLVRAPSVLRDTNALENALGDHLPTAPSMWHTWVSDANRERFYRFGWERAYLDCILDDWIVNPFVKAFRYADRIELALTKLMDGKREAATTVDASDAEIAETK